MVHWQRWTGQSETKLIMNYLIKIFFVLFVINFVACSSQKEIIEIKPIVIKPATIEDSFNASVITDTVIIGSSSANGGINSSSSLRKDTSVIVKYFPVEKRFYVKVKPDSIVFFDTVRTIQYLENKIETPLLSKLGLVAIGAAAMIVFFLIKKFVR